MSEPANFEQAQTNLDEAVNAAIDEKVPYDVMRSLTKDSHESTVQPSGEVQEATEVTQDVPVGEEFSMDFTGVPDEAVETNELPTGTFAPQQIVTNKWIKQMFGEEINNPVYYQNKLNKLAAYDMQLNGTDAKTARTNAEAILERDTFDNAMQNYKSKVSQIMEADWKEYIQTADPEEILSYRS